MLLEIYQADAFTHTPFKGNPAGVCITNKGLSEALMLSIAGEMAISETAFLSLDDMNLRWFTPKIEVNLCGHGTLATAHVLLQQGKMKIGDEVTFQTKSGPLTVYFSEHDIAMDFPLAPLTLNTPINEEMLAYLGISNKDVITVGRFDTKDFIVIKQVEVLKRLQPNFDGLKQLTGRGVVITALSNDSQYDFISRYFAPWASVNEDPVTGSAHCALAAYWSAELKKDKLIGYQASQRGGEVKIEMLDNQRVKLSGQAVTTLKGIMTV